MSAAPVRPNYHPEALRGGKVGVALCAADGRPLKWWTGGGWVRNFRAALREAQSFPYAAVWRLEYERGFGRAELACEWQAEG